MVVIEPREAYTDDRTWCFWFRTADRNPLIRHHWPAWRFSTPTEEESVRSPGWAYGCVPGSVFYENALAEIRASSIELRQGVRVQGHTAHSSGFTVQTSQGDLETSAVVDTTPPRQAKCDPLMRQSFVGAELSTTVPVGDAEVVGLMEAMCVDEYGFRFDYILPLAPTRMLVEATRFSRKPVREEVLEEDLHRAIRRVVQGEPHTVERREQGMIPMGLPPADGTPGAAWVRAGTGGGAVRAASGYAFLRIQHWAARCCDAMLRTGVPVGHPPEPAVQRWMDHLFLSVLREKPEHTPELFMRLARNVRPASLVRFLNDMGGPADRLAVVFALPPPLFLHQLVNNALTSRRQAA